MLLANKEIAIIGGGPGGLTLARLLQLKGASVKVYERDFDSTARVQGSPLDMHQESGLAALQEANLMEEFKNNFMAGADKELILNEKAEIFFNDHNDKVAEDFDSPYFRPEIDRGVLRKLLLQSLQPETVRWNSHFISMEKQGEGWLMKFKNDQSAYADLVIAADGANSKIRPYVTAIKPFYSGITMLEGNVLQSENSVPQLHNLIKGGKIMAFGKQKNLLMGQKGNGELGFYASFKTNENWAATSGIDFSDRDQVLAWYKKEYAEWAEIWLELFQNTTLPFISRPIYCMPLDQTWEALPNLTLIGDAAHVMPPFAGEGANMAMLDALELSQHLTNGEHTTLKEAIASFENKMRERAAIAAKESLDNGELMHSETALANMLEMFGGMRDAD